MELPKYEFKTSHIPYFVIAFLILYIIYLREFECNQQIKETVTTELTYDSTKVDSLENVITYLESLPPETTTVEIEVPEPTSEDSTDEGVIRWYDNSYSDEFLSASWRTKVNGLLLEQEFQYIPKARRVIEKEKIITKDHYWTRTTTIERQLQPNGYLSVGGFAGVNAKNGMAGPLIHFTSSQQNIYTLQYDAINRGILVGATFKLSFNNLLPWK